MKPLFVRQAANATQEGAVLVCRDVTADYTTGRPSTHQRAPCTTPGRTASPQKSSTKPEMLGPGRTLVHCFTDTRHGEAATTLKWRGFESYFRVSLGVARQRIVSKVVG